MEVGHYAYTPHLGSQKGKQGCIFNKINIFCGGWVRGIRDKEYICETRRERNEGKQFFYMRLGEFEPLEEYTTLSAKYIFLM